MPPVTKAGGEQFRKDVEFVTKDDDEQVAAGIVMVPDKADLQHDFAREETIRGFADQFETFVEAGEAGGGIMHAVFPDDWMDLERNEVLDESEEIGGETVDAGAWVQKWRINENSLWELIADDVLAGYSIGAIDVHWDGPYELDDDAVDDVDAPDDLGENPHVWELVSATIREVSAVDIPAVPDAQILETKADTEKRLGDYLGDPDGFLEEAQERGHSEADAQQLWDVLNEAVGVDGSDLPGKQSTLHRAGKAFLSALTGGDSEAAAGPTANPDPTFGTDDGAGASKSPEDADGAAKEGRTLSTANQHSLFATIDSAADVLEDAGIEHGIERFTDRDDVDFDLSEHDGRTWGDDPDDLDVDDDEEDGEDDEDDEVSNAKSVTKDDTVGVDVFRVVASDNDDTDYDGDLLGMGVNFPEHDVYVDWRREAFPDPLDDPHVSIYGSIDDLEQATNNVIESLGTVDSPTDQLANMAQRVHRKAASASNESPSNDDAGGDTPDDDTDSDTTDMSDDTPDDENDKSLAEQNAEQISDLTQAVENLTETFSGPEAKTAEIEIDGETYEVREDAAKAALGVDEESDIGVADAIERLNEKAERVDEVEDRLDTISQQSGVSTQLERDAGTDEGGEDGSLDQLGKMLN
jgi:hypothetical protein